MLPHLTAAQLWQLVRQNVILRRRGSTVFQAGDTGCDPGQRVSKYGGL